MEIKEIYLEEKNGIVIRIYEINRKRRIEVFGVVGYENFCVWRKRMEEKLYKPYVTYLYFSKKMRIKFKYSRIPIQTKWVLEVEKGEWAERDFSAISHFF